LILTSREERSVEEVVSAFLPVAERLLLDVEEALEVLPHWLDQYFFANRRYCKRYKGRRYCYDYVEVYAQAPRGADNARLVARLKPDDPALRRYELETLLNKVWGTLRMLRHLLDELLAPSSGQETNFSPAGGREKSSIYNPDGLKLTTLEDYMEAGGGA